MRSVDAAYAAAMARMPTPKLTRALIAAVERQAPPRKGLRRPKLRYAHQGGHQSAAHHHPRQLARRACPTPTGATSRATFATPLRCSGTPLSIEFRTGRNPYKGTGAAEAYARRKAAAR